MVLAEISIVLPTYNRIEELQNCIMSLFNQKFENWELIIVDDSSSDIVKEYIKKKFLDDKRVIYHKNQLRKGLPGSRNVGISLSNSDLILFIEDDIIFELHSLKILKESYDEIKLVKSRIGGMTPSRPWIFSKNYRKGGILDYALRSKNESLNVPSKRSRITGIVYSNFVPSFGKLQEVPDIHSCSLYPKKVLEEIGGYDEKRYKGNFLYEETDLNYRIVKNGYYFFFEPRSILFHVINSEGGCRVNATRYGFFFVINHGKYLLKNYNLKTMYMYPFFLSYIIYVGIMASFTKISQV
jgi:glycosyltransferase involved in cell wall biosynthesis